MAPSSASIEPGDSIGPYRIVARAGIGAMGVVHVAEHLALGRRVALKTVTTDVGGRSGTLRREIAALSRLHHPGIVAVLDTGVERGLPWYAMELVEGKTLRDRIATAWQDGATATLPLLPAASPAAPSSGGGEALQTGPRPALEASALAENLTLARRLCAPLSYLHGEGFVHCDVKPENVGLRADGCPVLIDFGLWSSFHSRDEVDGLVATAGTVAYAAPEQLLGHPVDARADIYALGCMLYEQLTGMLPFLGATGAEIAYRKLNDPLLPPSRFTPIPRQVDELVVAMLHRSPRDRIGHADDVAAELGKLGAEGWPGPCPPSRPYLYRPDLAGRDAQLARLVSGCRGAPGRFLIVGSSGAGKTRLALEAARSLGRDVTILLAHAPSAVGRGSASPRHDLRLLGGLLEEVADLLLGRGAFRDGRLAAWSRTLQPHAPRFGGLAAGLLEPDTVPSDVARRQLVEAVTGVVGLVAGRGPVLIVADDLQWADELSLQALEHLMRAGIEGLALIATCRAEETVASVDRLVEVGMLERFDISRLDDRAVGAMVGDMLALAAPPSDFVSMVARRAEGNPFFATEYVRVAMLEGLLARDERGRWGVDAAATGAVLPMPDDMKRLIERHLERLSAEARHVAELAAVIGRDVEDRVLERAVGRSPEELGLLVAELVGVAVLEEPAPGMLRFVHDAVREVAFDAIPLAARRHRHARAALALRGAEHLGEERFAAVAHHASQAGEEDLAREGYLRAARAAARTTNRAAAEPLYRAHLALCAGTSRESVGARLELAIRVLAFLGRRVEAGGEVESALAGARAIAARDLECEALLQLTNLRAFLERHAEAESWAREGLEVAHDAGLARMEGALLAALSHVLRLRRLPDASRTAARQAIEILDEHGDGVDYLRALGTVALLDQEQGELEAALATNARLLEISRRLGERLREGSTLSNMANIHLALGDLRAAEQLLDEAVAIHREIGSAEYEAVALNNLAVLWAMVGRGAEAEGAARRALAIHRSQADLRSSAIAASTLASILMERGAHDEARELEADPAAPGGVLVGYGWLLRAQIELGSGNLESAERAARDARARLEADGERGGVGSCRLVLGQLLALAGNERAALVELGAGARDLRGVGEPYEAALGNVMMARVARCLGESPEPYLDAARSAADGLNLPAASPLRKAIAAARA